MEFKVSSLEVFKRKMGSTIHRISPDDIRLLTDLLNTHDRVKVIVHHDPNKSELRMAIRSCRLKK